MKHQQPPVDWVGFDAGFLVPFADFVSMTLGDHNIPE